MKMEVLLQAQEDISKMDEDKPIETMEELNEFFDNLALEQYDHEKRIKKLEEQKK